jgi:ribosomal protein L37AE/L43A
MKNIVDLSEYRQRRGAQRAAAAHEDAPHYYCLRCDSTQFKLYASGMVHCGHCEALIRNILVIAAPSSKEADR